MPNLNKVLLMGNLTKNPEIRYLPSGMAVAGFGLAVNRRWKNQQGEQQEEATFIDLEAFGKPAETMNQYLRKGSGVYIEGRLKLDQWDDKEGQKRSKMKVVVESFQFIDGKPAEGQSRQQSSPEDNARPATATKTSHPKPQFEPVDEDDIPFD